jgi:DNA-directed RNA polymerase specialized sigma24 family protein
VLNRRSGTLGRSGGKIVTDPSSSEVKAFQSVQEAYSQHASAIYGLAWHICGPGCSEEVVAEVFAGLGHGISRCDLETSALRRSLLADCYRLASSICTFQGRVGSSADGVPSGPLEHQGFWQNSQLRHLPEHEAMALATAHYGKCTYRDAAVVLGITDKAALTLINNALRDLGRVACESSRESGGANLFLDERGDA